MDKKGLGILISCIISALLIIAVLIVTIRFTQQSCELIITDPVQLRSSALTKFAKIKPTRSHDKSMLMKISAHLEYISQTPSSRSPSTSASNQASSTQSLVSNTQDYNQQGQFGQQQQQQQQTQLSGPTPFQAANSGSNVNQQQVGGNQQNNLSANKHPIPSGGQANLATNSQMIQNSTNNLATPTSAPYGNMSVIDNNALANKKYLPLELEQVDMKKIDSSRYRYTLKFNCSVIEIVFNRNSDRVFVSSMGIEMKLPSRGKNKCELQLPSQGVFEVKVFDGLAHYYCSKPLKYNCYHYSSKNPGQPGLLLAELQINSIEFETGGNSSHPIHKSHEFQSTRSK